MWRGVRGREGRARNPPMLGVRTPFRLCTSLVPPTHVPRPTPRACRPQRQLGDLMEALHRMEPHYIRCIKPNSFNRPMDFENVNVLHQVGGDVALCGPCMYGSVTGHVTRPCPLARSGSCAAAAC